MTIPSTLSVALKEWATVCRALTEGRQILLLRKGGIYESGGEFELEHSQFLLFPTYLHQDLKMLKASEHRGFEAATAEPSQVEIGAAAAVTDILPMTNRSVMDALDERHIWTKPLIDMRFNYKPQNPLYLILLRVYRLSQTSVLANTPAYAGCKSWVPLEQPVATAGLKAVLSDADFTAARAAILASVESDGYTIGKTT
jgi:hypothetical protein